ncbi:MAG TPA: diacylglycerol kinase family protein [Bacteroidia bacterium]|nr:diacylglycerol kinase family protein [Bacteroidia bacterium]
MTDNFFVIANPVSGTGKAGKDRIKIESLLKAHRINYEMVFTARHGHERELAIQAIARGYRKFISLGGDGTLNQILNGIFNQPVVSPGEIKIGVIPTGLGNDWSKTFAISPDYVSSIQVIKSEKTILHDVGVVECMQEKKVTKNYFINIAGLGYDAFVVKKMNEERAGKTGSRFSYYSGILKYLFMYQPEAMKIESEEYNAELNLFSAVVAICKFNGGGMKQAPFAIPDDGLLDITIFSNISRSRIMTDLLLLKSGDFTNKDYVKIFKTQKIKAETPGNSFVEADGEYVGQTPAVFTILPKAVNMIINRYGN